MKQDEATLRREKIATSFFVAVLLLGILIIVAGILVNDILPRFAPGFLPDNSTPTMVPTLVPTKKPTSTSRPTKTNTPQPTLSPTPTITLSPTPTTHYDELEIFLENCIAQGDVIYVVMGRMREKAFISWVNHEGESDQAIKYLPQCIRFPDFKENTSLYINAKAANTKLEAEIWCQIYYRGRLLTADYTTEAGQLVQCLSPMP